MTTRLAPKLALATVAAVALYVPTLGLPVSDSCMRSIGVAGAAPSPSPSCGGDLRECLRKGTEMMEVNFVGTYVSAKNVSRCVEIFESCIHGGAGRGGTAASPPTSSSAGRGEKKGLPQHLGIRDESGISQDCRVNGDKVSCAASWPTAPDYIDSWSGTVAGNLSGLTMTGTATTHIENHSPTDSSCTATEDYAGPATFVFSPSGTVTMRVGPNKRNTTTFCNGRQGSNSGTTEAGEVTGTWSPIK